MRFWNGAKKLTTSQNSVISVIQDEKLKSITTEEPSEVPQEDELTVVVLFIKTVEKVQQYPLCIHCPRKLLQATASLLVKYGRCKHTIALANCNKGMSVRFTVQGQDESVVIVTAFAQTLKTVVPVQYNSSTLIVSAVEL